LIYDLYLLNAYWSFILFTKRQEITKFSTFCHVSLPDSVDGHFKTIAGRFFPFSSFHLRKTLDGEEP